AASVIRPKSDMAPRRGALSTENSRPIPPRSHDDRFWKTACAHTRALRARGTALPEARRNRPAALQRPGAQRLGKVPRRPRCQATLAVGAMDGLGALWHRFRAALDPVLGHDAPARQPIPPARARG